MISAKLQKEIAASSEERLRRKADQAWDMAGLARQDSDFKDADRHTEEARAYEAELATR